MTSIRKRLPQVRDRQLVQGLIEKVEGPRTVGKMLKVLESQEFNAQLQRTADHLGMTRQQVLREVLGR
jgi:uncharacterized ParB-like nuclease family protein